MTTLLNVAIYFVLYLILNRQVAETCHEFLTNARVWTRRKRKDGGLKAAHRLGINAIGIDVDRQYCEAAVAAVGTSVKILEEWVESQLHLLFLVSLLLRSSDTVTFRTSKFHCIAFGWVSAHVRKSKGGRLIVLAASEWKNGKKTGQARVIPLPEKIEAYVQSRLDLAGDDVLPLFPINQGGMWATTSLTLSFNNNLKKAIKANRKINAKLSSYCTRYTFITCALVKGISSDILAEVCGASANMIRKHYSHLSKHNDVLQSVQDMI